MRCVVLRHPLNNKNIRLVGDRKVTPRPLDSILIEAFRKLDILRQKMIAFDRS